MSKYKLLANHLAGLPQPFWRTSFEELEAVLGFSLPKRARARGVWWANTPDQSHQRAWLDVGWRIESVDRASRAVLFHRVTDPPDELPARFFTLPAAPRRRGRLKRPINIGVMVGGAAALAAALGAVAFTVLRPRK